MGWGGQGDGCSLWASCDSFSHSNPPVQTDVLEYGGLDMLWALVKSDQESETVQKRALFGVGSLLRRNPAAQHVFVAKHNGFDVLARKFLGSSPQFQLRAVTLVTDLVSEEVRSPYHLFE